LAVAAVHDQRDLRVLADVEHLEEPGRASDPLAERADELVRLEVQRDGKSAVERACIAEREELRSRRDVGSLAEESQLLELGLGAHGRVGVASGSDKRN